MVNWRIRDESLKKKECEAKATARETPFVEGGSLSFWELYLVISEGLNNPTPEQEARWKKSDAEVAGFRMPLSKLDEET